ncbi:MAG: hypothetical protein KIS67_18415 [Verrucomicrobiae bacterium]|nr:hypothetical protein [Verrucomicrobiae bacterium]
MTATKHLRTRGAALFSAAVVGLLIPGLALAADEPAQKHRLSFAPRVGFNVAAKFEGVGAVGLYRTTPNGDGYNYDDGYILTDISGNQGGQTWYWGYDDSAAQVSGDTIRLSRSTVAASPGAVTEDADPSLGGELVGYLGLGTKGRLRYGLEAAAGYQHLQIQAAHRLLVTLATDSDVYPFVPGTTPPTVTPSTPYQGSYQGPGFLIADMPSDSFSSLTPDVALSSRNELSADLWSFRVGPGFEVPLGRRVCLGFGFGIEAGWLNATLSWNESAGNYGSAGKVTDATALVGFYATGSVAWQFTERWSLAAGIQYHNLGTYEHSYHGRTVTLDLNNALSVTAGMAWLF